MRSRRVTCSIPLRALRSDQRGTNRPERAAETECSKTSPVLAAPGRALVVDACQSGGAVESLGKIGEVKLAVEQRRASDEKASGRTGHGHQVGVYILAAATPVQEALEPLPDMKNDNKENSLLTTVLLQALNSDAAAHDSEIWVESVFKQVSRELPKLAQKYKSVQTAFPVTVGADFPIATK